MAETLAVGDLVVGSELAGPPRVMTVERIQWYGDGLESAIEGQFVRCGSNIHTDEEFAKSQGLPGVIADGMLSTNWISAMLVRQFGTDYLERGALRTKFIKPIFKNVRIHTRGQVRSIERADDGSVRYVLDVWCADDEGTKLTVGDAAIVVAPRG